MIHLKKFNESFYDPRHSEIINNYREDIQDVLQDLIDEGWVCDISYTPKRWENPKANYHIKSDYISVDIRRNKCKSGSIYPPNSDFKPSDISDYTLRLADMYNDHDMKVKICLADDDFGRWCDANIEYLSNNFYDVKGIIMIIYLDGENIDLR